MQSLSSDGQPTLGDESIGYRTDRAPCEYCAEHGHVAHQPERDREEVAKKVEESPAFDRHAYHRPAVQHKGDAAEEASGTLPLACLKEESVRLSEADD
eukprot:CAMPEP_0115849546 /NCGR_PEP_ID=MMETSP0287-20121206/11506_1 /TAXON_ID=412157 /ORGANISM="Chrysochromulina rotalis, Strain UIO044" /LENGTH=97 /DNA_ID=CAMNT_0003303519 /DNA_START=1114 /DNA_END=1407 /DNA_ORIENTATION=+